jgi:hypothetical protein
MNYSIDYRGSIIAFDAKPDAKVLAILKGNGFRWNPSGAFWWRKRTVGTADVLDAIEKAQRPANQPDGACWHCRKPEGRFRNHGASAPVLCDECERQYQETHRYGAPIRAARQFDSDGQLIELHDGFDGLRRGEG